MAWAATTAYNAQAQSKESSLWDASMPALQLKSSTRLEEVIAPALRDQLPSYIKAEQITGQADINSVLEGGAELRRADTVIRADRVEYTVADDTVNAQGNVHINRGGNVYQGTALKLQVDAFQGDFTDATYQFLETQGHGNADRIEFIDRDNTIVYQATYTTCLRDDAASWTPDWVIRAKRIELDRVEDVGVAYGGTLEFKGVPIIPVPAMSFPLSDKRKSGLLPPTIGIDSVSGVEYSQPYYWNIAPNRDATITPTLMSKRGVSLGTEFRYLEPTYRGALDLEFTPNDKLRDRDRWAYNWKHATSLATPIGGIGLNWNLTRVSDDNYWRDFSRMPGNSDSFGQSNQRLLSSDGYLSWSSGKHSVSLYAQKWQVLQDIDAPIAPPFNRVPQLQWRYNTDAWAVKGWDVNMMAETTRFEADTWDGRKHQDNGQRSYGLLQVSRPVLLSGGFVTPKVQLHTSNYQFEDFSATRPRSKSFSIPTLSLDSGLVYERDTTLRGRGYTQTLEPRAFYTYTPYRDQSMVPLYDTALTDFNFGSIYSENSYTGRDRIADNHLLTIGVTTRYLKPEDGSEVARLGIAQRLRFEDQRVGLGYDALGKKGWSDILVGGGITWNSRWSTDGLVQYNRDTQRTARSSISARYTPGPYKTLSAAYRFQREDSLQIANQGSEQVDFGWQWPLNAGRTNAFGEATGGGRWYSVGRLNYSMYDKKLVDAIVGFEYDSCCWIGRVVVERMQNSRNDSNTRLLFQIEFVGLSRLSLGADPLRSLQEFVPGYRPLRDHAGTTPSRFSNYD
ncbi:LPS-assembly protein LptD [Comamonas avium]|uniref:LPS-assembly protein LptD n=1 Tax=Comamonas avium TaxID=2762231 RepID=A0ABR8S7T6_9BURK|nr:LPS-assembly protein LptD [Comamonas avium]